MTCIIGIAGSLASGKSVAARALSEKYTVPVYSFGKLIEHLLLKDGIEPTRGNLQRMGTEVIQRLGYGGIANLLLTTYGITESTACIIEGIRHIDVIRFYEEKFRDRFISLFIDSPREIRFARIKGIEYKKVIVNTIEEFDKIDNHQIEQQISFIKEGAKYIIDNNRDMDTFLAELLSLEYCR